MCASTRYSTSGDARGRAGDRRRAEWDNEGSGRTEDRLSLGRTTALIAMVALTGVLSASAREPAVDHVWLSLGPVRLGDGWNLTASATSRDFDTITGDEILGATLERKLSGRARETHALRAHLEGATVSFDGQEGRWHFAGRAGRSLAVDMTIRATGEPEEVAADESLPFACRGSFARVPVTLTGTFALRTGTKAFESIERARLMGVITYNQGGPVECGFSTPPRCEPSTFLSATGGSATGSRSLTVDRGRRGVVLQFTQPDARMRIGPNATWSHVLALSRVDVLAGELPSIRVRFPAKLPVTGSATFAASKQAETIDEGCRTTTTEGAFDGGLRVRFSAWGGRTFGAAPSRGRLTAFYRVTGPA